MKTVLFINHREKACGVYQFGKRVGNIFAKTSVNYRGFYYEPYDKLNFRTQVNELKPDIIIYNYLPDTMPWFGAYELNYCRAKGIKQGLLVHNVGYAHVFDFYLHQIPEYPENGNNYALPRPLFKWDKTLPPNGKLTIGTFGFGFKVKRFQDICKLVNAQIYEPVDLKMHMTLSHFIPNKNELEEIKAECRSLITRPYINLVFSEEFLDDDGLLTFLAGNDLNIYLYQYYDNYNGISGVTDYFLSVRKPIAICKSSMFSHINRVKPSICVEETPLKEIIKNGFAPLQPLYDAWSHENFTKHIENVLERI